MGRSSNNLPVVLLVGKDQYLRREYVDRLKKGVPDLFNYEVLDGGECGAREIISAASTMPFGPGARVVVVRDADGLEESDRKAILEYMADPSPTTRLLLLFDKLDKRSRLFREAHNRGWVRTCSSLAEGKLMRWLREKARDEYGKDLPEDAARLLVDLAGTDMSTLANELEKLSLYVGDRRRVRLEDVEEIVVSTRQHDIWGLVEAIADKDESRALHIYSRLMRRKSDVYGMPGLMRWNLNRIWLVKAMLEKGASQRDISSRLKVGSYKLNDLIKKARSFQEGELHRNYRLLFNADWRMKTGQGDPRGIMERLIIAFCG